jgi:hypothetical protein
MPSWLHGRVSHLAACNVFRFFDLSFLRSWGSPCSFPSLLDFTCLDSASLDSSSLDSSSLYSSSLHSTFLDSTYIHTGSVSDDGLTFIISSTSTSSSSSSLVSDANVNASSVSQYSSRPTAESVLGCLASHELVSVVGLPAMNRSMGVHNDAKEPEYSFRASKEAFRRTSKSTSCGEKSPSERLSISMSIEPSISALVTGSGSSKFELFWRHALF